MEAAFRLLKQSRSQVPPSSNPKPRNLQSHEAKALEKQRRDSVWDEGVIDAYMRDPTTQAQAFDLRGGHTLILTTHWLPAKNAAVACELEGILEWLDPGRPFQVFLWLRDDPRIVGANEWPSRRSVNGGWTIPGSSAICVYREEEWERVVLHEMIHAMEWDWKMPDAPDTCWSANPGQYTPALFEAWTELLAEWFWCGWTGIPWSQQRAWQEHQALQILTRHDRMHTTWKENTSVFAYYILKTVLAPHMPFLWIHQNGDTPAERRAFLCPIVAPELQRLKVAAQSVKLVPISLRMTVGLPAQK